MFTQSTKSINFTKCSLLWRLIVILRISKFVFSMFILPVKFKVKESCNCCVNNMTHFGFSTHCYGWVFLKPRKVSVFDESSEPKKFTCWNCYIIIHLQHTAVLLIDLYHCTHRVNTTRIPKVTGRYKGLDSIISCLNVRMYVKLLIERCQPKCSLNHTFMFKLILLFLEAKPLKAKSYL